MKHCSGCGLGKPRGEFYKRQLSKDGLHGWCKDCGRVAARESYQRLHPDRRNPWTPEKDKAYRKRYRDANRERIRERNRVFKQAEFQAGPEKVRARVRAWRKAHPERTRLLDQARKARRQPALEIRFSADQLAQRMSMWDGCWMCLRPATEVDHVKPIAKGGAHALCNLRPICRSCNSQKRDKWPVPTAPCFRKGHNQHASERKIAYV